MKQFFQFRQGDVLLDMVKPLLHELPEKADALLVRKENAPFGHFATGDCKVYEGKDSLYVYVYGPSAIEHLHCEDLSFSGEHQKIELPKGLYRVIQQRSYDPLKYAAYLS